jgi:hypothetical protein
MTPSRIGHRIGTRTLLAQLLLVGTSASVVVGLEEVVDGLEAVPLIATASIALLMGWLLAKSPLPGWLAGGVALSLGGEAGLIWYGRLGGQLLDLPGGLFRVAWATWLWSLHGRPDPSPVLGQMDRLARGAWQAGGRLWAWAAALAQGEPAFDPWAVTLAWNLVVGGVALWAAWAVRRHQRPLAAAAPAGALVAGALSYGRGETTALYALLLCALPLLGLIGYSARLGRWQREGVDYAEDIGLDLGLAVVGVTIALTLAALVAPSVSVRQISRSVQEFFYGGTERTDQLLDSFGIRPGAGQSAPLDAWRERGLPRSHLIGSGPELEEQVVMAVRTSPSPEALPQRLYWRSLTFDRYTGAGWATGPTERVAYQSGEFANDVPAFAHQILHQEIETTDATEGLLYAAGTPMTADHRYQVSWRTPASSDESSEGDLFGATLRAPSYRVVSWIPTPTEAELGPAGAEYPDWIRERYLALPPSLPSRVVTLTRQMTTGAATPYARATAIESYLRTLTYTLDLPAPPAERDIVDTFLFDLREGYCDYFASAMVVMARAAGLPARLVVGYASGTYDRESDRFWVTEADAHSWAEIYFPDTGWIEFEPTAGRALLERPEEAPRPEMPEEWWALREGRGFPGLLRTIRQWWWLSILVPPLVAVGWELIDRRQLRRLSPAAAGAALYRRVVRHGRRLRVPVQGGDTPHEFAESFGERVADLGVGRRWSQAGMAASGGVRQLADYYVRTVYSRHAPDAAAKTRAIEAWHGLRWRLWLGRLWQWVGGRESRGAAGRDDSPAR